MTTAPLTTAPLTTTPSTKSTPLTKREKTAIFILDFLKSNQNVYQFIKNPKTNPAPDLISFVYGVIGLILISIPVTGASLLTFKITTYYLLKLYNKVFHYAISISLERYKTLKTKKYYYLEQKIKKDFEEKAAESIASKTTSWINESTSKMGSLAGNVIGKSVIKVLSVLGSTGTTINIPIIPFISTLEFKPGNLLSAMINTTIFNYLQQLTHLIAKWYNKYISSEYVIDKINDIINDLFQVYYSLIENHLKSTKSDNYKEKLQEIDLLSVKILMLREYEKLPTHKKNITFYNNILKLTNENKKHMKDVMELLNNGQVNFYNLKNIHKLNSDNVSSVNSWNDFDVNVLKSIISFTQYLIQLRKDCQKLIQYFKTHVNGYINPWFYKATPRNELKDVIEDFKKNEKLKILKDNWGDKYPWQQLCEKMRIVISNNNKLLTRNIYVPDRMVGVLNDNHKRYSYKSTENPFLFLSVETPQEFYDTLLFLWNKNALLIYMYTNLMKLRFLERLCFNNTQNFIEKFDTTFDDDVKYSTETIKDIDEIINKIINKIILISCSLLKSYKGLLPFYKLGDNFDEKSFSLTLKDFKNVFDVSEDYCKHKSFEFYDYENTVRNVKITCSEQVDKVNHQIQPNNHIKELLFNKGV